MNQRIKGKEGWINESKNNEKGRMNKWINNKCKGWINDSMNKGKDE